MKRKLSKKLIQKWLNEADSWDVGHVETFDFGNWSLRIRREETIYEPHRFSVDGHRKRTAETMSRRYMSIEAAMLHVVMASTRTRIAQTGMRHLRISRTTTTGWSNLSKR